MTNNPPIHLAYPLYLNVPMMTSFLAALTDGIAYSSSIKRKQASKFSDEISGEGQVGISPPSIAALLKMDLRGKLEHTSGTDDAEEIELIRQHTEASLFMQLRTFLEQDNALITIEDLQNFDEITHGNIVEITGQIFRSPATSTLDTILGLVALSGVEINDQPEPRKQSNQQQGNRQQQKKLGTSLEQAGAVLKQENNSEAKSNFGLRLMKRIRDDLVNAKVIDVVMEPISIKDLTIVISLSSEFLTPGVLETLLSGHFTVLGKVSRVLKGDDSISLYQRTVSGTFLTSQPASMDALKTLQANFNLQQPRQAEIIKAPALQVIPLAIFV